MKHSPIKPIPYYSTYTSQHHTHLAKSLREDILPKIKRRLPNHHLCGLPHGWVINFIKSKSSTHPFFLRTDIRRFYPSIRHTDLAVGVQIAYRDLLGLKFVPHDFKRKHLGGLNTWLNSLPVEHRGIPLSSPLSCLCAPLMLVPVWLQVKKYWRVPIAVYMDDILILCKSQDELTDIYSWLQGNLYTDYDLELNSHKTESGRFSCGKLSFCGWHFAGGTARVADAHIAAFKTRFKEAVKHCPEDPAIILKRLNRKIDGFGNYYKHGNVKRQFEALDIYIRSLVRPLLVGNKRCDNEQLSNIGLRSLCGIYTKHQQKLNFSKTRQERFHSLKKSPIPRERMPAKPYSDTLLISSLNSLSSKLVEIIALQKKQLRYMATLTDGLTN